MAIVTSAVLWLSQPILRQEATSNKDADLPGHYMLPDNSRLMVYGQRQWFTPCAWDNWDCHVSVQQPTL